MADTTRKDGPAPGSIHEAASSGDLERLERMLKSDPAQVRAVDQSDHQPLHWAAREGQAKAAELLLANGADANAKTRKNGWTPLHLAAMMGREKVVELLLASGAEVNARDAKGNTPLLLAATIHVGVVRLLIARGADVNARNSVGNSPLSMAQGLLEKVGVMLPPSSRAGAQQVVDLLRSSGAGGAARPAGCATLLIGALSLLALMATHVWWASLAR